MRHTSSECRSSPTRSEDYDECFSSGPRQHYQPQSFQGIEVRLTDALTGRYTGDGQPKFVATVPPGPKMEINPSIAAQVDIPEQARGKVSDVTNQCVRNSYQGGDNEDNERYGNVPAQVLAIVCCGCGISISPLFHKPPHVALHAGVVDCGVASVWIEPLAIECGTSLDAISKIEEDREAVGEVQGEEATDEADEAEQVGHSGGDDEG